MMSPYDGFATVMARIATGTSVIRTRRDDQVRSLRHASDLDELVAAQIPKLEKIATDLWNVAAELEKATA